MWLPYILPDKCLKSSEELFNHWEVMQCDRINLQICRILLSVHKKTSRLATIGELGRYPLFTKALSQCLNYKTSLLTRPSTDLVARAISDMKSMSENNIDCWLTRVNKIERIINLPSIRSCKSSGKYISKIIRSKFDLYWLSKVNEVKLDSNGQNHNKLRTYSKLKGSFHCEPYITNVRNRNQRCQLTRLRCSASLLGIERMRYTQPVTPLED